MRPILTTILSSITHQKNENPLFQRICFALFYLVSYMIYKTRFIYPYNKNQHALFIFNLFQ